ncbi:hypothetical protein MSPP1_003969 [Malassezia sp. CBS 17886]|nr:hypothetical protein MSPP1_003969 [Malassezia sp. CBS 17886]
MPVSTLSILAHVTPTLVANAMRHYVRFFTEFGQRGVHESAGDFYYDQAFHLVKALTELLTHERTEDIQKLTNTSTPMPLWGCNEHVLVPMSCCEDAAQYLVKYLGPEKIQGLVGGSRWWQMRSLEGIDAEWISMKEDSADMAHRRAGQTSHGPRYQRQNPRHEHVHDDAHASAPGGVRYLNTDEEQCRFKRVLLYIHGGGYYFGSVNTHRYQILRITRKFGGFAFAVNYRKAPQYPFPCALQDCLAAYLYLIRPPPGAGHPPVDPSQIVVAGDSAGGGLALALLQLLRDLHLQQPAGGVLISPWSDLTHSFPSILQNTKTDFLPPYSFIHKPSTLWPMPADAGQFKRRRFPFRARRSARELPAPAHAKRMHAVNVDGRLEPISAQIQVYATNAQLFSPLCSPALSGSLGGLPPLHIIAGNNEVLRDEIIYVAHKAAHPALYPPNPLLVQEDPRLGAEYARYKNQPTNVHLQVFDGQCHVFTAFLLTTPAKYAFRAIASFIKYVTGAPTAATEKATSASNAPRSTYASAWSPEAAPAYNVPLEHESRYSGKVPLDRPAYNHHMIRERVSTTGIIRPMEPAFQIPALCIPPERIGLVHAQTYARFRKGHTLWDTKYAGTARRVQRQRQRNVRRYKRILAKADAEGLLDDQGDIDRKASGSPWHSLASFGPTDLHTEQPPPSAIVGRRDTPDAIALLKRSLYLRARARAASNANARGGAPLLSRPSLADVDPGYTSGELPGHFDQTTSLKKRFGWWKTLLFRFDQYFKT